VSENASEYVYFIATEDGRFVKIGLSREPEARCQSIQVGLPVAVSVIAVIPGDRREEKRLQYRFRRDRAREEWFHFTREIRRFVDALPRLNTEGG
jgi:hypothetical protein